MPTEKKSAKKGSPGFKTFVLDTNVLVQDPLAMTRFPHHHVVIPVTALEELDKLKRLPGDLGANSRAAIRFLDSLRTKGEEDLNKGVSLDNGSKVRVQIAIKEDFHDSFNLSVADNRIIMAAYLLQEQGETVVFVSKDLAARVKAEAVGLEAEDYLFQKFSYEKIYRGIRHLEVSKEAIDRFYKDGFLQMSDQEFTANEYAILTATAEQSSAVARYNVGHKRLEPLPKLHPIWGINPRNVEQRCALDLLLRDDVPLVTLMGIAGTGKTLLALACGLRKVFDDGIYTRALVSRPIVPLGRDIGYLPGTKEEKLFPWMQPIFDNLEFICNSSGGSQANDTFLWVTESKKFEMEAVTYIRGRSLPKMYIIIDEAQNLTPHEIKTVISRAGEGTKVILTGDATQIDHPYLDKDTNGLTYTVMKCMGQPLYGHLFLEKTERSALSALAAEVL